MDDNIKKTLPTQNSSPVQNTDDTEDSSPVVPNTSYSDNTQNNTNPASDDMHSTPYPTRIPNNKGRHVPQPTPTTKSYHPVGSSHKEQGPIQQSSEIVMPSESAESSLEISPELKEAGVESQDNEKLQLSVEDKLAGIEPAKESVPFPTAVGTGMQIPNQPFTLEEAKQILQSTKTDDTTHWLASLLIAVLHKKYFHGIHQKFEEKNELMQKTN